jgi:hypothetical protein
VTPSRDQIQTPECLKQRPRLALFICQALPLRPLDFALNRIFVKIGIKSREVRFKVELMPKAKLAWFEPAGFETWMERSTLGISKSALLKLEFQRGKEGIVNRSIREKRIAMI